MDSLISMLSAISEARSQGISSGPIDPWKERGLERLPPVIASLSVHQKTETHQDRLEAIRSAESIRACSFFFLFPESGGNDPFPFVLNKSDKSRETALSLFKVEQ